MVLKFESFLNKSGLESSILRLKEEFDAICKRESYQYDDGEEGEGLFDVIQNEFDSKDEPINYAIIRSSELGTPIFSGSRKQNTDWWENESSMDPYFPSTMEEYIVDPSRDIASLTSVYKIYKAYGPIHAVMRFAVNEKDPSVLEDVIAVQITEENIKAMKEALDAIKSVISNIE